MIEAAKIQENRKAANKGRTKGEKIRERKRDLEFPNPPNDGATTPHAQITTYKNRKGKRGEQGTTGTRPRSKSLKPLWNKKCTID